VQEIFAVQALRRRHPDVFNDDVKRMGESFVLPDEALADVAGAFLRPAKEEAS
jgi:hypothetical protein